MGKIRGFEVVEEYKNKEINLPRRATKFAAAYDVEAAEDIVIPMFKKGQKPVLIKTGIKSYFLEDEVLYLYNRSSNPKRGLVLANSVGVIDADYYNNENNEGHLLFAYFNYGDKDLLIKKGERIGQAIFQKKLLADDDSVVEDIRSGGFGSTGIN